MWAFRIATACVAVLAATAGQVQATIIVQSTLNIVPGQVSTRGGDATEVDYWYFSANSGGIVSIDILSWQWDKDGDGTSHFMDPYIYLFTDDGALDTSDLISSNDDSNLTFGDGSTSILDSYMSVSLLAGDYVLAISDYFFTVSDAVSGINYNGSYPAAQDASGMQQNYFGNTTLDTTYADYQITFEGDITLQGVSAVPEPSHLFLFGIGASVVGGIGACRRRRREKQQEATTYSG